MKPSDNILQWRIPIALEALVDYINPLSGFMLSLRKKERLISLTEELHAAIIRYGDLRVQEASRDA